MDLERRKKQVEAGINSITQRLETLAREHEKALVALHMAQGRYTLLQEMIEEEKPCPEGPELEMEDVPVG